MDENNFGTVSLDDTQPQFGTLSLTDPETAVAVPQETAQPRAIKAHIGLGDQSPGYDTLYSGIANGEENRLRQDIATQYNSHLRLKKMSTLQDMAQQPVPDMKKAAQVLAWQPNTDPNTIFENTYAQKYVRGILGNNEATTMQALAENQPKAKEMINATQNFIANQESFRKIAEEYGSNNTFFNAPTIPQLGFKGVEDFAKSAVPFVNAVALHNILVSTSSLLPGNNLDEQIAYLWSRPTEEASQLLKDTINKLKVINPQLAQSFAESVINRTGAESFWENVSPFVDATIIGGPLLKLARILKGSVLGNISKEIKPAKVLEATGDTEKAAEVTAKEIIQAKNQPVIQPVADKGFDPMGQQLDLSSILPSYSNPKSLGIGSNIGSLSREGAQRIIGQLEQDNAMIGGKIGGQLTRVSRLTQDQLNTGLAITVKSLRDDLNHVQDAIIDFRHLPAEQTYTNVDYVLANIGKEGKPIVAPNDLGFPLGPINETPKSAAPKFRYPDERGTVAFDEITNKGEGKVTEFTTAAGSKYILHEDGTTTRNKAVRNDPEHEGDFGPKPRSVKTVYLTEDQANRLAPSQGKWKLVDHEDGTLSTAMFNEGGPNKGKYGISPEAKAVGYSTTPAKGLIPLELWKPGTHGNSKTFSEIHFGNAITDLESRVAPQFLTAKEADFGQVILGKPDATLFNTYEQANRYLIEEYGLDYRQANVVEGPGGKWIISVMKPVDETSTAIRSLELETKNTNSESWWNFALKGARTPADQVAPFQRNNRLIATLAPTEIQKMIQTLVTSIEDLQSYPYGGKTLGNAIFGKASWEKLNDVLAFYRDFLDYSKPNPRGMWPTSFAQLQKDWKKVTGVLPNEREQLAFFRAVKIADLDYMLRNYNLHRDLARQGIENVHFPIPGDKGSYLEPTWGKVILSDHASWLNKEDAVVAIILDGQIEYTSKAKIRESIRAGNKALEEQINKNRIVQIASPESMPFRGSAIEHNPQFIITDDLIRNPLPVHLVNYNGGGHLIYAGEYYAKQPIVNQGLHGRFYHYGDQTLMNFSSKAQADRYVPRLEALRVMFKEGKSEAEITKFLHKNLPEEYDFWLSKFEGPNAILSKDHPIMLTQKGRNTFTTNPDLKQRYTDQLGQTPISFPDSPYNLTRGIDQSFLMDRDGPLQTIRGSGRFGFNPWAPVYKLEKATVLKPLYAMERGIYNAIRGLYLNDVKTSAVEQWAKQYASLVDDVPIDQVLNNPYYYFYHGKLVERDSTNFQKLASAEQARVNLKNFLRTSSDLQGEIDIANEVLLKKAYDSGLIEDKDVEWFTSKNWPNIKHPIDAARAISSHLTFGFYNPIQLFKQSMGASMAISLDPLYGLQGAQAAHLHAYHWTGKGVLKGAVSDGMLDILDTMAITGGWKKGTFKDSVKAFDSLGVGNVGRSTAWRDSINDPALFDTKAGKALDKSYFFFNGGDRFNRMTAWHMAYKRFINDNPERVINARALGEILNNADQLWVNMTKESNSAIQKGWFGPALTFRSFQMRTAELMASGRLTPLQKARAYVTSSTLFGIPITVGAFGIPLVFGGLRIPGGVEDYYDDIKKYMYDTGIADKADPGQLYKYYEDITKYAENKGITVHKDFIKLMHDGILDTLTTMLTGKEYNVSKAYGPGPEKNLRDIASEPLATIFGPPGSMLSNAWQAAYPFYAGIYNAMRGGQDTFAVTHDEILDVAKEIGSVRSAVNGWYAANYQLYVSKNKDIVANDMSKTDSIMLSLLGVTRKDIADTRIQQSIDRDVAEGKKDASVRAIAEYRKAFQAINEDVPNYYKFNQHLGNAKIYMTVFGHMQEKEQQAILDQAMRESGTLMERVNRQFYDISKMPIDRMPTRLKAHFGIDVQQGR